MLRLRSLLVILGIVMPQSMAFADDDFLCHDLTGYIQLNTDPDCRVLRYNQPWFQDVNFIGNSLGIPACFVGRFDGNISNGEVITGISYSGLLTEPQKQGIVAFAASVLKIRGDKSGILYTRDMLFGDSTTQFVSGEQLIIVASEGNLGSDARGTLNINGNALIGAEVFGNLCTSGDG